MCASRAQSFKVKEQAAGNKPKGKRTVGQKPKRGTNPKPLNVLRMFQGDTTLSKQEEGHEMGRFKTRKTSSQRRNVKAQHEVPKENSETKAKNCPERRTETDRIREGRGKNTEDHRRISGKTTENEPGGAGGQVQEGSRSSVARAGRAPAHADPPRRQPLREKGS